MKHDYRMAAADEWYRSIIEEPDKFPFAFKYDGVRREGFSNDEFTLLGRKESSDEDTVSARLLFRLDDNLHIRLQCRHYMLYGASEWTVWFENPGTKESGIISNAEAVMSFIGSRPELKGILGDHVNFYRPYSLDVAALPRYFESNSGRATHVNFPYFNLEYGDGGALLAIGWAGTWRADFSYDAATNATLYRARSVNNLHTRLKPGEKIRTALFAVVPYAQRNEFYAQNCWRSWFVRYNLPKADASGEPFKPFSTVCLANDTGLPNSDGSISERWYTWRPSLEKMLAENIKIDFRWFDAGWYIAPDGTSPESDWWGTVGTWTLDPNKWPNGTFKESTDFTRAHGMKTLMWFEPERVTNPEALAANYGYDTRWAIRREGTTAVSNNIGDPDCLHWTAERIKKALSENKVEMYREDNNSDQAMLWSYLDAQEGEGRNGITECRFIDAHYHLWDDIIDCTLKNGGCGFVDSCASGGGRNDLESLRRGVPLLRSDYDRTSTAMRLSMTSSFNGWVPACGANTKEKLSQLAPTGVLDKYVWRASYLPVLNIESQFTQDPEQDFDVLRFGLQEWRSINAFLLKDFYLLTPWHSHLDNSGFTAFAYSDPGTGDSILLAFRQEACTESKLYLSLPFLEPDKFYRIKDADSAQEIVEIGCKLIGGKYTLTFSSARESKLLRISELK